MKNILRMLHLSGGRSEHHHHRLPSPPSPAPPPSPGVSNPDPADEEPVSRGGEAATAEEGFGSFEEEYQVQLAMAISASHPDARKEREVVQIDAAKRISLGCPVGSHVTNYSIVNYNERVMDGYYDVSGIISNRNTLGNLPSHMNLQEIFSPDGLDYDVVMVNRAVDSALQQLERTTQSIASQCQHTGLDPIESGLVQKIANIVVERMGGPVGDADDMLLRWKNRSHELRIAYKTAVLPLGCLDMGLSHHRALLFKVLADKIGLPCRLVKGSYYTGTDDGAVNLIKTSPDCEYIIDLMGAPGALIPAEVPSVQLHNAAVDISSSTANADSVKDLCSELDEKLNSYMQQSIGTICDSGLSSSVPLTTVTSLSTDFTENEHHLGVANQAANIILNCDPEFGRIFPFQDAAPDQSAENKKNLSITQKKKVKNVSKYVISAAQNPEFAQKLHAVLLESGASPPPDLFSDINLQQYLLGYQKSQAGHKKKEKSSIGCPPFPNAEDWNGIPGERCCLGEIPFSCAETKGDLQKCRDSDEGCARDLVEVDNDAQVFSREGGGNSLKPILDDVAGYEILWEDLQLGERIGLGSFGEVYRADLNGTEVAVKKFLDQDFSGDALEQFRSEIQIMARLRHPNIVLFMGAVMRPPNLSILTEFLPRGSLYRLLHRSRVQLDEKRRLKMALDVAKGMNYLHTSHPIVVHRDLKSPNLLVDRNWVVKVCDFGLSRLKHHTFLSSKSSAGTPEWMAPEVLRNEPSNEKCDVYSFGVILWELATMRLPWSGMNSMQVVGAVGFQHRRLDIPKEMDSMVAQIIQDCWHSEPNLRPSFSQLMDPLKRLKKLVAEKIIESHLEDGCK